MFSLNFSLAGKRPFMTSEAKKKICQRRTFLERKWGEGHDPDLTGKFA